MDDSPDRLAHIALAGIWRANPISQCARLRRAAPDIVQRDRADKLRIFAPQYE